MKFYLHLCDGRRMLIDDDGFEAEDIVLVLEEATRRASVMLASAPRPALDRRVIVIVDRLHVVRGAIPLSSVVIDTA